jgi:hypothetical protein
MRGVSRWASRVAPLLAAFVVLAASSAGADETSGLPTDPQARVQPPGGVAAQARMQPPGVVSAQARVQPPVGRQSRMQPPVGGTARMNPPVGASMTLAEMILVWLQSRLSVPHG